MERKLDDDDEGAAPGIKESKLESLESKLDQLAVAPEAVKLAEKVLSQPKDDGEPPVQEELSKAELKDLGFKRRVEFDEADLLIRKMYAGVYRAILADMEEFVNTYLDKFDGIDKEEQNLEHFQIYSKFEAEVNKKLEAFAAAEGKSLEEVYELVAQAAEKNKKNKRMLKMIVNAADFKKFVKMMNKRRRKFDAGEDEAF